MEFVWVDVFAEGAYRGNQLAVFPEASELSVEQMQAIARETNLSETTFVTAVRGDGYEVRIFTPYEEMPFAGHPTIGTAWVLSELGMLTSKQVTQTSPIGGTSVELTDDVVWLERPGEVGADVEDKDPGAIRGVADAVGLEVSDVGLEGRELGRPGRLRPAFSDAGLRQLMVPVRDLSALQRCTPRPDAIEAVSHVGIYCFTATGAGRVRARGFFPGVGVAEDPATGSAAAALGLYLADRFGAIDLEVRQGEEVGRPSLLRVRAQPGDVRVGGSCVLLLRGRLERLP